MRHYLSLLLLLICMSCSSPPPSETTSFAGRALTIDYNISIGSKLSSEQSQKVQDIIDSTFAEINALFTTDWNPQSELSKLNRLGANIKVKLSQPMEEVLTITGKIVSLTHGKFDPTIGPLNTLWKTQLSQERRPPKQK